MKCPVCNEPDLVMAARQNIEIDYCPQCRGVWLDRGELDKLIERSVQETEPQRAAPVASAPPREYRDHEYSRSHGDPQYSRSHGDHDRRYKKKSFWHEIFD